MAPAPEFPQLRLGMLVGEAQNEVGPKFKVPHWDAQASPECNYFEIEGTRVSGVVISKRIATVSFNPNLDPAGHPVRGSAPESLRGLRPGQSVERAEELFGQPNRITSSEGSAGEILFWRLGEQEGHEALLRVDVWGQTGFGERKISSLEVGLEPAISYVEGCA